MTFVVEEDEACAPADVGLFGADSIVCAAQCIAHRVQQFFGKRLWVHGCSLWFGLQRLYTAH